MTTQPIDLAQLRAINDARTPGEWEVTRKLPKITSKNGADVITLRAARFGDGVTAVHMSLYDYDAAFITAASENFGPLLDEVEALRARVAELETHLAAAQPPPAIDPLHAD